MRLLQTILRWLSPVQTLLVGFVLLALVGAFLLTLPLATQTGAPQPFLDALFMAMSAVSTTGLGVVGTGSYYTPFGQVIILILFQIGGLGYMTLIAFVTHLFGRKLSWHGGTLMETSMPVPSRGEMREFVVRAVIFTAFFEGAGTLLLTIHWLGEYSFLQALYQAVFHAVSAFCTAGFSLFDSGFNAYQNDAYFNLVINLISISGAVGFFVLSELHLLAGQFFRNMQADRLSIHSKLALLVLVTMIVGGTAVVYFSEGQPASWIHRFQPASFQVISAASTTGFNTVDIGTMNDTSLVVILTFMFIGAPTGGTGGGIKSTTFAVILLFLWTVLRGRRDVNAFGRRLTTQTIIQSVAIALTAVFWLIFVVMVLTATEQASFLDIAFEATSALGTVGLSTGLTPQLSAAGKFIITITMFIGRVGPLTVAFAFFRKRAPAAFRYPPEEIFVG